ncbi:hypothetical protein CU097_011793 [Rhizopus azygosporus]|uniref:Uncharacterized protein n=1 Tax=Rhizopus azygosporus TaxID=86630 RepID=A0A367JMI1_RHIAZ|nr:hypothetical protein CU097_011793 [Rhizopus azygosporus]
MEMNYCLYCEKRLADDNMAFCSVSCQSNEASKDDPYPTTTNIIHDSYFSYHRRPTLAYKAYRPYPLVQSLSSASSVSSSLSDVSSIYSCSCDDKGTQFRVTRTTS